MLQVKEEDITHCHTHIVGGVGIQLFFLKDTFFCLWSVGGREEVEEVEEVARGGGLSFNSPLPSLSF